MSSEAGAGLVQGLSGALLVGLAGFLYMHASYFQRFQHAAASQSTRTSLSFAFGIAFLLLTSVVMAAARTHAPQHLHAIEMQWWSISPLPGLNAVFILAPIAGLLFGLTGNVLGFAKVATEPYLKIVPHLRARMRLAALGRVAATSDDQLLVTLWPAMTQDKLVQVTLKDRKVYVGSPFVAADPSIDARWLKIIPLASGYRDPDSLVYVLTTSYIGLFERLASSGPQDVEFDLRDLAVIVSWDEVLSVRIFNPELEYCLG